MLKDQCISVTELRTKTKKCLEHIEKAPKFIFFNNHPIAVLVGISEFEACCSNPQLMELQEKEVTPTIAMQAKKARKVKKSDLVSTRSLRSPLHLHNRRVI